MGSLLSESIVQDQIDFHTLELFRKCVESINVLRLQAQGAFHAGGMPVASQVYANVEGWRTPEVQRFKNTVHRDLNFITPARQRV